MVADTVSIKHEKGVLRLKIDAIDEKGKKTIMSWSDGTWKLANTGFYDARPGGDSYRELVVEGGRVHSEVVIAARDGESVIVSTAKGEIKLPLSSVVGLAGISSEDSGKMERWIDEIIQERIKRAKTLASTEVIRFDESKKLNVTNIRARILQVLDEGVLASRFVGELHKGVQTVRTTMTVTVDHPLTGAKISKVTGTTTSRHEVNEEVSDDLCYIVGNTARLTEGQVVKIDRMRLVGRYQYVDVRGAERSVRKYHVD